MLTVIYTIGSTLALAGWCLGAIKDAEKGGWDAVNTAITIGTISLLIIGVFAQ